jgi:hypothetical protein
VSDSSLQSLSLYLFCTIQEPVWSIKTNNSAVRETSILTPTFHILKGILLKIVTTFAGHYQQQQHRQHGYSVSHGLVDTYRPLFFSFHFASACLPQYPNTASHLKLDSHKLDPCHLLTLSPRNKIILTSNDTGIYNFASQTAETAAKTSELLQQNHEVSLQFPLEEVHSNRKHRNITSSSTQLASTTT